MDGHYLTTKFCDIKYVKPIKQNLNNTYRVIDFDKNQNRAQKLNAAVHTCGAPKNGANHTFLEVLLHPMFM